MTVDRDKQIKADMARPTTATFMQPQQPDAILAALVGSDPLPRTQITIRLWKYIKTHALQDSVNRRQLNAYDNDRFRAFLGGADSCTMFELPTFVNAHITPVPLDDEADESEHEEQPEYARTVTRAANRAKQGKQRKPPPTKKRRRA